MKRQYMQPELTVITIEKDLMQGTPQNTGYGFNGEGSVDPGAIEANDHMWDWEDDFPEYNEN